MKKNEKNKKMKNLLIILAIISGINTSCSQHKSVPDYLLNQKFPDSVLNYQIQNRKGEKIAIQSILEKHQGKKIVVDTWASWCKDCLESLPDLQQFQKTTGNNVSYVYLSLDKSEERWLNAIDKLNIKGDHYFMPSGWKNPLTNYIGLDWIPRYFIIDEEGKIVLPKAVKVNEKEFSNVLK